MKDPKGDLRFVHKSTRVYDFWSLKLTAMTYRRQAGRQAGIGATPSRYASGQALEKGAGCLSRRIAGPPRRISFSRKGAKPQRNLTANGSILLVLGSCLSSLVSWLSALAS